MILKRVRFKPAAAGSGHLLERQTVGHQPRTTESQTLVGVSQMGWFWRPLKCENHWTRLSDPLFLHPKDLKSSSWILVGHIPISVRVSFSTFFFFFYFIAYYWLNIHLQTGLHFLQWENSFLFETSQLRNKTRRQSTYGMLFPMGKAGYFPSTPTQSH